MIYTGDFKYTMASVPPDNPTSTGKSTENSTPTVSDSNPNDEPTDSENPTYPTLTPEGGWHPLCYRDMNDDNRYQNFNLDDSGDTVKKLCYDIADSLTPDAPLHAVTGPNGLSAWVAWADNQDGCVTKTDYELGDWYYDSFWSLLVTCDGIDESTTDYYGGGFVHNLKQGCVEVGIGSDSKSQKVGRLKLGGGAV
ncbi:hypothetical protein BDW69DRAFT_177252 [Aspergillus filifer]